MSLLGDALDLLRRYGDVVGVDWDDKPGILDRASNTITAVTGSPILAAAQVTIQGMKATTGSGEPQAGEALTKSSELYEEAGDLLIDATPKDDLWDGTASNTYRDVNNTHRHLTLEVVEAEREVRAALRRLAAQVTETRTDLQDAIDFLSDYDTSTSWMNAIPGGAQVKAAGDLAVAATQIGLAEASIAKLVAESASVALALRTPRGRYQSAADEKDLDPDGRFPCGEPLGDERTEGTLPSRTNPTVPYMPPEPEGPPVVYPPARPYESVPPR